MPPSFPPVSPNPSGSASAASSTPGPLPPPRRKGPGNSYRLPETGSAGENPDREQAALRRVVRMPLPSLFAESLTRGEHQRRINHAVAATVAATLRRSSLRNTSPRRDTYASRRGGPGAYPNVV